MAAAFTLAPDHAAPVAAILTRQECAYCGSAIGSGERLVRRKIYEPFTPNASSYQRYHADLLAGEGLSCWEKDQMERELARAAVHAA